eukprot:m.561939 g.561939  ORF g.561939 m.561939 type:complete len:874 (+) comp22218_c0_seq4:304-2925(+)
MKKRGSGSTKPEGPFICETCGKKFKQEAGLKYHVSKKVCTPTERDNSEQIPCEKCGKKFGTKGGLQYHQQRNVCTRKAAAVEERIAAQALKAKQAEPNSARNRRRKQQASDDECQSNLSDSKSETKKRKRRKVDQGSTEKTEELLGYRVSLKAEDTLSEHAVFGTIVHQNANSRAMGHKVYVMYDNGDEGWISSTRKGLTILRSKPRVSDDKLSELQHISQVDAAQCARQDLPSVTNAQSDDSDSNWDSRDDSPPQKSSASRLTARRQRRSKENEVKLRAQRKATLDRFPASFAEAALQYTQGGFAPTTTYVHAGYACRAADVEMVECNVSSEYLPAKVNVKMRFNKQGHAPTTLAQFQSVRVLPHGSSNHGVVVNASGMVQCMDWCPTPDSTIDKAYLAVATDSATLWQSGSNTLHDRTRGKSCIQFWGVGVDIATELEMVLCLDEGSIKAMRWCPSGGYERGTPEGKPRRLGLLAVGTLNKVLVFAVPRPDCLEGFPPGVPKRLRLEPQAVFVDGAAAVTALAWSEGPGCSLLASGCEHGTVAIYSVADGYSPAVEDPARTAHPSGAQHTVVVAPVRVLQGLGACVTSIAWCPHDPAVLAVAGYADVVQVWELPTGTCLEQVYKVPQPYARRTQELLWPRARDGVFIVDEHPAVRFCDFAAEDVRLHRTILFAGDAMTATMQDMLGVFVAGSDDGALIGSLSPKIQGFDSFSLIGSNAGTHHLARFVATDEPEEDAFTVDGATPTVTSALEQSSGPTRAPSAAAAAASSASGAPRTVHVHLLTEDLPPKEYKTLVGKSLGPLRQRGCTLAPGRIPRRQQSILHTLACQHAVAGQYLLATANATGAVLLQDLAQHEAQLFRHLRTPADPSSA